MQVPCQRTEYEKHNMLTPVNQTYCRRKKRITYDRTKKRNSDENMTEKNSKHEKQWIRKEKRKARRESKLGRDKARQRLSGHHFKNSFRSVASKQRIFEKCVCVRLHSENSESTMLIYQTTADEHPPTPPRCRWPVLITSPTLARFQIVWRRLCDVVCCFAPPAC